MEDYIYKKTLRQLEFKIGKKTHWGRNQLKDLIRETLLDNLEDAIRIKEQEETKTSK